MLRQINYERAAMLGIWMLAALACILGLLAPPPYGLHGGKVQQILDLIRVTGTGALAVTLLLGPGIIWRASKRRWAPDRFALTPLPGLAVLIATGSLAWVLAGELDPRVTCFCVLGPAMCGLLGGLLLAPSGDMLDSEERWVLLVVGCALGVAIARALWSLAPSGELLGGTISRTLEVGDRPDSRISYHVVQLVAHGTHPFSSVGNSYFLPYNFSSRGPLPGLASAPIVLMSGGRPPLSMPNEPWQPFDAQGFMAYRLAMMTFACTAFVGTWELARSLGGKRVGRLALTLAATTPFLVHEIWFTWPKLLAAFFVILAGSSIVARRPFHAGVLVGIGYLMHPGALLSLSALGLLALWPLTGADWRRPQIKPALLLMGGVAIAVLAWRLVNGPNYSQDGFSNYITEAGVTFHAPLLEWLSFRAESVANTIIPFFLILFHSHSSSINVVGGTSPPIIHFFFQYWNTLPFGVGIIFFPLLMASLWHAVKVWRWPVFAVVVAPFIAFAVYWGAFSSGLMREGLQAWTFVLLIVVALQQRQAGYPWLRSKLIRAILSLRSIEVLAVAALPAIVTGHRVFSESFALSDTVAFVAMISFCAALGALVWTTTKMPQEDGAGPSKRNQAS